MAVFNVVVNGNVGREPEYKMLPDGRSVVNLSLAYNDFKGETTWIKCEAWGQTADSINQHVTKGASLILVCRFKKLESFLKRDKTPGASLVLTIQDWSFAGNKVVSEEDSPEENSAPNTANEDIPF